MLELVVAGGWLMVPILLGSVLAVAICAERFVALRPDKVLPPQLFVQVRALLEKMPVDAGRLRQLQQSSPLGLLLATGIANAPYGREVMKESMEEVSGIVVQDLQRYLNMLGTIALVEPMLGLVGSVIGIMQVFGQISVHGGVADVSILSGGISEALITTASGLVIAIFATVMHRYFSGRVDSLVLLLEQESLRLVNSLGRAQAHGGGKPA
jgi:biopolymer transport protein ExbB